MAEATLPFFLFLKLAKSCHGFTRNFAEIDFYGLDSGFTQFLLDLFR